MADVLTPEQRRLNMSRIRAKDTKPEILVRRGLHRLGFRFRLHDGRLPGRPDLVLPRYRTVIFVHGCFWHDHGCILCKRPATRLEFWQAKFKANKERDEEAIRLLLASGWRVLIIWECSLRGPVRSSILEVLNASEKFIKGSDSNLLEVAGRSSKKVSHL